MPLIQLGDSAPESEWLDAKLFCLLVCLRDSKTLMYDMFKDAFDHTAAKNLGSVKRLRHRIYRSKDVNQFLNRQESLY